MTFRVCRTDAVAEGDFKEFRPGGIEVLVVNLGGRFYCLASRCTHAGAPLYQGELVDSTLVCPWHGSTFRVTDGAVLKGPAEQNLRVYPTSVDQGYVSVEIPEGPHS